MPPKSLPRVIPKPQSDVAGNAADYAGPIALRDSGNVEDPYYVGPDAKERLLQGSKTDELFYQYMDNDTSVARPGFNQTGREIQLVTNTYEVNSFPTRVVYQYDVSVPPPLEFLDQTLTCNA
jgi:hypothetical protein